MKGGGGPPRHPWLRSGRCTEAGKLLLPVTGVGGLFRGVDFTVLLHFIRFPSRGEGIDGVCLWLAMWTMEMRPGPWATVNGRGTGGAGGSRWRRPPGVLPRHEAQAGPFATRRWKPSGQSTKIRSRPQAHTPTTGRGRVLFRALKGAGPRGLRGILEGSSPDWWPPPPLLPAGMEDIRSGESGLPTTVNRTRWTTRTDSPTHPLSESGSAAAPGPPGGGDGRARRGVGRPAPERAGGAPHHPFCGADRGCPDSFPDLSFCCPDRPPGVVAPGTRGSVGGGLHPRCPPGGLLESQWADGLPSRRDSAPP